MKSCKFSTLFLFIATIFFTAQAQERFTLSGYVKDASNGEDMFSVNVYVKEIQKGTTTNIYGFYSLTLPKGTYEISYSFLGYETKTQVIDLTKDIRSNINLQSAAISTDEVVISSKRRDQNVDNVQVGVLELEMEKAKEVPALLGEVDIFRVLQLMPGVMSSGEGNSGLYVRGGGPDQNLVLLDNATVYNPGHLLGFFSVFNSDAIKNTTLIKGGIPAEYGGRLSSVLDISMREGNMKEYEVEGGLGLISTRATFHGPIVKDKASFLVSGRFTQLPFIINPILKKQDNPINVPFFFDVNAKMNFILGEKDRLFISSYVGRDKFSFSSGGGSGFNFEIPWGNATTTVRWNHQFNDKVFMNNMFIFNDYTSKIKAGFQGASFNLNSGIRDYGLKGQIEFYPSITNKLKAGYEYIHHSFTPYIYEFQTEETSLQSNITRKYAHEFALFIQDEIDITSWLKINIGIRGSMFSNTGPSSRIYFNEQFQPIDTVTKTGFQAYATYFGAEPRFNARFKINDETSIKTGVNLNKQYMHLVSSSTTTLPTDLWVPSTDVVKPETAIQGSVGIFRNFKQDMFETSIEVYYKRMWNQIEFGTDVVSSANEETEDLFTFGDAFAYGSEFFIKKNYGKFNGWVGYTLSWTMRKFEEINEGRLFPAKYDRRHDLSIVLTYDISKKFKLSSTFVYGSGQNTTIVENRYFVNGRLRSVYGDRNGFRLAPYHRLDFGVTYIIKDVAQKTKGARYSELNLSIFNLYSRMNPYFIYDDISINELEGTVNVQAKQVSLFPILPTLTWNFKF
jgi:hypothetical protein